VRRFRFKPYISSELEHRRRILSLYPCEMIFDTCGMEYNWAYARRQRLFDYYMNVALTARRSGDE
jgi:hypothetical protein